ncbi:TPR repeat protein [Pyricularia oryzae]|uniref:TPR repeat protein n=2 Tax=Pyricularia oryzae TaxID=318829 RepID=A0AA97P6E8_PYRO3|nr:TPR repeat protein [Pyricularia oryzae Y34]KAI7914987.1 TPR repeat protein [Pyricularia oryzae]KAI7924957.1 TPR repeat protein [Pyricularia oryzae]
MAGNMPMDPGSFQNVIQDLANKACLEAAEENRQAAAKSGGNGTTTADGMAPELPPDMAKARSMTTKEILDDLNKSPLFMTDLEENDDIAALQALAYEGTPLENASDFKERGNECFVEKRWADAREFYTKGINILAAEIRRRARGELPGEDSERKKREAEQAAAERENGLNEAESTAPTTSGALSSDDPEEIKKEAAVLETLYANRAACQLSMQNYRSCTLDCAQTLTLNPRNVKAFYRSAKALSAMGKMPEAEDAAKRGLAVDPDNAALKTVAAEIVERQAKLSAKQKAEADRQVRERRRQLLVKAAIRQRGVRMRTTPKPPEMEDARVQLVPDPDDANSELAFPAIILYPVDAQSDFIKAFGENDCMNSHLSYLLPLPWDRDAGYTQTGVECYVATEKGTLVKLGKKVPLIKVLSMPSVVVEDELVRIFVLPKSKAAKWVKDFTAAAKERATS